MSLFLCREDKMIRHKALVLLVFLIVSLSLKGNAQDTHYWTHQYGTRSTLLGGLVIGSVLDLSGTYYNPGGLSLIEDPETILAAKIFHYPSVKLKGLTREDIDLSSSYLGPAPSLIAGRFKFKWLGKHWLGYSVLTRQEADLTISGTVIDSMDMITDSPGDEDIVLDIQMREKLTEPWWGITWSYKVNDRFGIGISPYVVFRSHSVNTQGLGEALTTNGELALTLFKRDYSYMNTLLVWKLGVALDFDRVTFGLTMTTPSIKLYGDGTTGINITMVWQDLDDDGTKEDYLAADYQDGLDANYRTPLSVGFGMTFKFQNVRLYGSAEWFDDMDKYEVMSVEDFPAQSSGEMLSNNLTHELDSVLNYGIGIEYNFNQNLTIYSSFCTDFSAQKPGSDTNLSISDWDIHHIQGGTTFKIKRSEFTLGLGYAWGKKPTEQKYDIPEDIEEGYLGFIKDLEFKYSSIKFIIGFAF